jgi:single-stranded DNA-binding protein
MGNFAVISGYVSKLPEPEIKTAGDNKYIRFGIAVKSEYKDKEGNYPYSYFTATAWNKQAEFVDKYFPVGSPIELTGAHEQNSYTTGDGETRKTWQFRIKSIGFPPSRRDEMGGIAPAKKAHTEAKVNGYQPEPPEGGYAMLEDDEDDLPF